MAKRYLCIKDFFMQSGEREFTKGKFYESEKSQPWLLVDDGGTEHFMDYSDMLKAFGRDFEENADDV